MSRINGSDAQKMFEAYASVYAPQQESVVEEVVDENLEQLDEMGQRGGGRVTGSNPNVWKPTPSSSGPAGGGMGGRRGGGSSPGSIKPATSAAPQKPATPASTQTRPAAPAPTKPAAPAAGPKVSPSSSAAAPKPSGTPMQQWASKFPKLAAKVTPSGERAGTQMGTGQSTMSKQAAELRAMRERISNKPAPAVAKEEYDAYDLVLEYLLDNGHAETVDEAHYLMIEMNAEMINDIVEAKYGTKEGRHKLAMKIKKGEEVGKSGPGTGFAAVEKAAKKGGARDPKAVAAAAMWKTYGK